MSRWFPGASISRIHGQPSVFDGVTVVPMFHPAAALHRERYRALIEADFARLPAILAASVRSSEMEVRGAEAAAVATPSAPVNSTSRTPEAPEARQMRLL